MPRDENAIEAQAIAITASTGFMTATPVRAANGKTAKAASMSPKKKPANAFPRTMVNNESGAASNLSKVPVCFSRTTATASIDVVPKSTATEVNPATIRFGLMLPAMLKAKYNETGIKKPNVKFGALK